MSERHRIVSLRSAPAEAFEPGEATTSRPPTSPGAAPGSERAIDAARAAELLRQARAH